jgi:Delta7-sterol 5-desaturase
LDSLFYFLHPEFWLRFDLLALFVASIFVVVLLRYFLSAGAFHLTLNKFHSGYRGLKRLNNKQQLKREILWSTLSSLIFAILTVVTFYFYQRGFTKIYIDVNQYSGLYFIFSIAMALILYETYYYWLHRWMHNPKVFSIVHKVHHESIHTSVFTSFSFHPLEAFLQFLFLPVFAFIIPIHYLALGIVLTLMTISAVINHAGIEIFSMKFLRSKTGKWFIGSTHHDLHHREFKTNYGLYLTLWDKWMHTESKKYEERLTEHDRINQSQSPHHL